MSSPPSADAADAPVAGASSPRLAAAAGVSAPPAAPAARPSSPAVGALITDGAGPLAARAKPERSTRPRWWGELLVIVWLLWVYDLINDLAPLRTALAIGHARSILHLEQTLHLDPEHTLDRWLAGHHTLGLILSLYYDNAHFVVTFALLGWLWWRQADLYRPLRNSLVIVNLVGFAVFWLYPVAPPRLLKGFTDVVAASHTFGSWHTGALASQANQVAAMPSLHIGWAVWCTVALWRLTRDRRLRLLALAYPCLTAVAVLATGNHFLFDIFGGLAAIAIAILAEPLLRAAAGRLRAAVPVGALGGR